MPTLEGEPFSLTIRQDVVNAAVATLVPPEELMVLLDYVVSLSGVMSFQAADQLGPTQIVKIVTQETPELLLDQGRAKVAQLIVLEVFATSEVRRPFFTLGIEASSEAQFYTKGDQLTLNLNEIRVMVLFLSQPELLKDITTEMLTSALLPNENGASFTIRPHAPQGFTGNAFLLLPSSPCGTPCIRFYPASEPSSNPISSRKPSQSPNWK
uniref:Uncharacterized protein n=1 Tax=Equus asinus asinus TaxID=83772 RepID=A0A8C4LSD7_EQUAS